MCAAAIWTFSSFLGSRNSLRKFLEQFWFNGSQDVGGDTESVGLLTSSGNLLNSFNTRARSTSHFTRIAMSHRSWFQ
jgi:hypothetical protein